MTPPFPISAKWTEAIRNAISPSLWAISNQRSKRPAFKRAAEKLRQAFDARRAP